MTPLVFFFNDTATTEIYTLSLHDALPIFDQPGVKAGVILEWLKADYGLGRGHGMALVHVIQKGPQIDAKQDRKSTRLNSSHANISYAVFCLKKKKNKTNINRTRTTI